MYDFGWHEKHAWKTERSAIRILSILQDIFEMQSLLDIGCGDGTWLRAARELGFSVCKGVDGPWTQTDRLKIPKEDLYITDLEGAFDLGSRFDLAVSFEVAEHIQARFSDRMVSNMVAHSDLVAFGAAIPFQGGFRHVNEQWQSFWLSKFDAQNYVAFDVIRPQIWDDPDVWFWYKQNVLVYVNAERLDLVAALDRYIDRKRLGRYPVDLVHPAKYEAIASYEHIAFRPLLKQLPSRLFWKAKDLAAGRW